MAHLLAHLLLAEAVISIVDQGHDRVDVLNELPELQFFGHRAVASFADIETLRTIDYLSGRGLG